MAANSLRARGRPPRAKTAATIQRQVRLTDAEARAHDLAAGRAGRSWSEYVRLVVSMHITTRGPPEARAALFDDGGVE